MNQKMKMPKIMPKNLADDPKASTSQIADKIIADMRSTDNQGDTQRITVDMPKYLYDIMKEKMGKKGYSMKTYIVGLVRKDVGDE